MLDAVSGVREGNGLPRARLPLALSTRFIHVVPMRWRSQFIQMYREEEEAYWKTGKKLIACTQGRGRASCCTAWKHWYCSYCSPQKVITCAIGQFSSVFRFKHIRLKLSSCSAINLRQFFEFRLSSYVKYRSVHTKNALSVTVRYAGLFSNASILRVRHLILKPLLSSIIAATCFFWLQLSSYDRYRSVHIVNAEHTVGLS